jgi:hypothetical protein
MMPVLVETGPLSAQPLPAPATALPDARTAAHSGAAGLRTRLEPVL